MSIALLKGFTSADRTETSSSVAGVTGSSVERLDGEPNCDFHGEIGYITSALMPLESWPAPINQKEVMELALTALYFRNNLGTFPNATLSNSNTTLATSAALWNNSSGTRENTWRNVSDGEAWGSVTAHGKKLDGRNNGRSREAPSESEGGPVSRLQRRGNSLVAEPRSPDDACKVCD